MKNHFIKFSAITLTAAVMAMSLSCKDKDEPNPELSISPSATDIVFLADGVSLASGIHPLFTVTTNQSSWDVEKSEDWVKVSISGNTFTLSADRIDGVVEPKPATVTVTAGKAKSITFGVQQLAAGASLVVSPALETGVEFSADGKTAWLDGIEKEPVFTVATNVGTWDVAVSPNQTWLTVKPDKTNNKFTLEAAAHTELESPEPATVTISAGDATEKTITVTQAPRQWINITGDVLKNTTEPYATVGDALYWDRFYTVSDWKFDDVSALHGTYDKGEGGMMLYAHMICPEPHELLNGKLYQTVELEAGGYKFEAYTVRYTSGWPTYDAHAYIVATIGNEVSDFDDALESLASDEFPFIDFEFNEDAEPILMSIEFTLSVKSTVSLGFVANMNPNAQLLFRKIDLWKQE